MDYIFLFKYYSQKIINYGLKALLVIAVLLGMTALFISFLPKNEVEMVDDYSSRTEKLYKLVTNAESNNNTDNIIPITIVKTVLCTTIGSLCTNDPKDALKDNRDSLVSQIANFTAMPLANPPASGTYYVFNKIKDAGLIPNSYAAPLEGIGFASLKPFQNIWLLFRNFVYLFFVIIIVIIGFMIMFRAKLGAQTVISVESALPKIAISLILVTFSFAIAGFMIDLMYVSLGIIVLVFSSSIPNTNINELLKEFFYNPQIFGGSIENASGLTWRLASSLSHLFPNFVRDILSILSTILLTELGTGVLVFVATKKLQGFALIYHKIVNLLVVKAKMSGTIGVSLLAAVIEVFFAWLMSLILSQVGLTLIIFLLLIFTIILVLIRITFLVLYSYINILLLTILSPVIIAFEAIPGKSTFSGWLKSMTFHLLTFPALTTIVLLSRSILALNLSNGGNAIWQPPGIGALDSQSFQTLIGASLIFMAPDLIKTFKQLSGIKPMSNDVSLMGLFAGGMAVGSTATGLLGKAQSFSYITHGLKDMGLIKTKPEGGSGSSGATRT